jgi:hypothetical protein
MEKIGLNYKKIYDNELEFTKNDIKVTYLINTSNPHHLEKNREKIKDFTDLIIIGHDPDSTILKYTNELITFWGSTRTYYNRNCYLDGESEQKNQIIWKLNRETEIKSKFIRFNLIKNKNDIVSTDKWNIFLNVINSL